MASEKDRRSISIDSELNDRLNNTDLNASAVINRFLREYFVGGDTASVATKLRLQDIEREIDSTQDEINRLQNRLQRLRQEREKIEKQMEREREETKQVVEEARDVIGSNMDNPDNPAVQNWADKANMTPEEFVEVLKNGSE